MLNNKVQLAVFASGNGTNAENIAKYFIGGKPAEVAAIFCNNPNAFVIKRAEKLNIPLVLFTKNELSGSEKILSELRNYHTDFIILAGFLLLIPDNILSAYKNRIVNIHPALLPKYGGKGMYGQKVHEAVKQSGDIESGISIHYVNESYDKGNIIFQAKCKVDTVNDTADSIAEKVHQLEYKYYPEIIEGLIKKMIIPTNDKK